MNKVFWISSFAFILLTAGCNATGFSNLERITCTVDKDCWNSCQYGAVNKNWYETDQKNSTDCLDGCAGVTASEPKCVNNTCVAYTRNPSTGEMAKNDYCTNKQN